MPPFFWTPWMLDIASFALMAIGAVAIFWRWRLRRTEELLAKAEQRILVLEEQRAGYFPPEDRRIEALEAQIDRLAEGQEFLARVLSDRVAPVTDAPAPAKRTPDTRSNTPH